MATPPVAFKETATIAELLPRVTPETVGEFLKNGAFATAAGSALVSAAALKAGDWAAITARAKQFVAAAHAVK